MKESIIQKGIMDYLAIAQQRGYLYWFRAGAGAVKTESGRYFKTGKPGVPDIVVCLGTPKRKGVFVGLEVKNEKGRQSARQKQAEAEITAAGGFYYIVRSISDAKEAIKKTQEIVSVLW